MVTIFLLFQLVAGNLHEVDAFVAAHQCSQAKAQLDAMVEQARAQRPDLPELVTECRPVQVTLHGGA